MKKIFILVLVVALVVLGLQFYGGVKAKEELDSFVEVINNNPGYEASWSSYDKGWMNTNAVLNLSMQIPAGKNGATEAIDIPLNIAIGHGPLLLNNEGKLGWFSYEVALSEEHSKYLSEHLATKQDGDLFQNDGFMSFAGDILIHNAILPFTARAEELNIDFAGLSGNGVLKDNGLLTYQADIGEFSFNADNGSSVKIAKAKLTSESDYSRIEKGSNLMPGKGSYTIPKIETVLNGKSGALENVVLAAEVVMPESAPVANIVFDLSAGKGNFEKDGFSDFGISLSYDRISLKLIETYMAMVNDAMKNGGVEPDPGKLLTAEVLGEALGHKPGFSINKLNIKLPEGQFDSNFSVALQAVDGVDSAMIAQNPMMLMQGLLVNLNMKADKSLAQRFVRQQSEATVDQQILAEQAAGVESKYTDDQKSKMVEQNANMMLQMMLGQNFIVEDGNTYKTVAKFENGESFVNGKPMPLPIGALMGGGM